MKRILILLISLIFVTSLSIVFTGCGASSGPTGAVITDPVPEIGEMVLVPSGDFRMGSQPFTFDADENPLHTVMLDAYYINIYEVTNAEYASFLNDSVTGGVHHYWYEMEITQTADGFKATPGLEKYPVKYVNHENATAYADWLGGSLPTEAQWEKAARGPGNERHFPWGNHIYSGQANYDNPDGLVEVGIATGRSYYGCFDMAGNVWEWTADWYQANYYQYSPRDNPPGPLTGEIKSVRGGGYMNYNVEQLRCAERQAVLPEKRYPDLGFRCVIDSADYVLEFNER